VTQVTDSCDCSAALEVLAGDGDSAARGIDIVDKCSAVVLMQMETLGIARSLGGKMHMRCAYGQRGGMKRIRECAYRKQLDIDTLVCMRGPNFPLSRLEPRLICPACRSRRVTVMFEPPTNHQVRSG
jgi:hypothetical protein